MALILTIDTATAHASVCLSRDGKTIGYSESPEQKDHASFIQPAIKKVFDSSGYALPDLDAVAVSNGPGSYTGLRVGLATAKGICYALDKPLILINTLEIIAKAAIEAEFEEREDTGLFCPMIDARRMEVFAAVYDKDLILVRHPAAVILDEKSFADILGEQKIYFSGSGATKLGSVVSHNNAVILHVQHNATHMQSIAEKMYLLKSFADKAYSEPYYLKEFFTTAQKIKSD